MKPAHGGYADYLPPRGLTWVWWQLQCPPKSIYRRLRRMYRHRWPPPEVSSYLGMRAMIVGEGAAGRLHVGSVGVISKSEVYGDHRVYHIEFGTEGDTVVTQLPNPGCVELIPHEDKS
ncbi:MAG: hypothetical protein ACRDTT_15645 [Pseudonocardiaceae bacterium]